MESKASSCVAARLAVVEARDRRSMYILLVVDYGVYLCWFEQVRQPHLFEKGLREMQRGMWFNAN